MKTIHEMFFSIAYADSYESNTPSCAHVDTTPDAKKALDMWHRASKYQINQFMLITVYTDGTRTCTDLDEVQVRDVFDDMHDADCRIDANPELYIND